MVYRLVYTSRQPDKRSLAHLRDVKEDVVTSWKLRFGIVCIMLLTAAGSVGAVASSLTVTEKDGVGTANSPMRITRPFMQGEIADYPQALVCGVRCCAGRGVRLRANSCPGAEQVCDFLTIQGFAAAGPRPRLVARDGRKDSLDRGRSSGCAGLGAWPGFLCPRR